ncbi:transposase [Salmonella enterica subsp. enterica]|nr:transposase [Salmonella enterica subsp. enterica]
MNDTINAFQTASQKRTMPLQNGRMTMNQFIIGIWFGDNLDDHFRDRVFTLSGKQVQLVTGDGCKIMIDSDAILQPIDFLLR